MLGQWPRGVVAQLSVLHRHCAHGGTVPFDFQPLTQTPLVESINICTMENYQTLGESTCHSWSGGNNLIGIFVIIKGTSLCRLTIMVTVCHLHTSPVHLNNMIGSSNVQHGRKISRFGLMQQSLVNEAWR